MFIGNKMIICVCNNVTKAEIEELIAQGYGLVEIKELTEACTVCCACREALVAIIQEYKGE